jgi:hypothetical protein
MLESDQTDSVTKISQSGRVKSRPDREDEVHYWVKPLYDKIIFISNIMGFAVVSLNDYNSLNELLPPNM